MSAYKTHYRSPKGETQPACGSNPTWLGTLVVVSDPAKVNCSRCQITIRNLEKAKLKAGEAWTREFLEGEG